MHCWWDFSQEGRSLPSDADSVTVGYLNENALTVCVLGLSMVTSVKCHKALEQKAVCILIVVQP